MNEFLSDLAADSTILWAVFVLGVTIVLSLTLYIFWETIFALIRDARHRTHRDSKGRR